MFGALFAGCSTKATTPFPAESSAGTASLEIGAGGETRCGVSEKPSCRLPSPPLPPAAR